MSRPMNQQEQAWHKEAVATLTERLAQAERERDAAKADYREMRQAWDDASEELAIYKADYGPLYPKEQRKQREEFMRQWEKAAEDDHKRLERERDDLAQMYSTRTRERDEWQAQAKVAEGYLSEERAEVVDLRAERDAALAKAEAAERLILENAPLTPTGKKKLEQVEAALTDLRARIEALADVEEKDGYTGRAFDLRALLQPPKAETALDVLSKVDAAVGRGDIRPVRDELAKLRKLLEDKQKDPP